MQALGSRIRANTPNIDKTIVNVILITNAFVWYYFIIIFLQTTVGNVGISNTPIASIIWILHFGGIIISAIIGAFIVKKISREKLMIIWMLTGLIISLSSMIIDLASTSNLFALSLLFGVSLGFGMPTCMGYFSQNIPIERRGFIAGVIFLLSGVIMALLGLISEGNVSLQTFILSGWRLLGLVIFSLYFIYTKKEQTINDKHIKYRTIITQKAFVFYVIPWTLFALITYLSIPIQTTIIEKMQSEMLITIPNVEFLRGIENVILAVSAVVCGFLADRFGRKRIAIAGFAMIGIAYSIVGIAPYNQNSWYIYTVFDGFALGILYMMFVITIWADLSGSFRSEKYYAIGVLPFFISFLLRLAANSEISSTIDAYSIFSFIAVFLFLAVLPLVYAPETLPDKVMKDRDLKSYVEKAKQKAQKETEKEQRKTKKQPEEKPPESAEEKAGDEYEKARALAEKYY